MKKLLLLIIVLLVFGVESANTNANAKRLMGNWTVSEIFPKLINNQWGAALADSVLVMRYNDSVRTLPFYGSDSTYVTKAEFGVFDSLQFNENNTGVSEGIVKYNDQKTLIIGHPSGVIQEACRTMLSTFIAEESISKGQVCYVLPTDTIGNVGVKLATADSYNENWVLGVAASSATSGQTVEFMQKGIIPEWNADTLEEKVPLYLCSVPGGVVDVRPPFPCKPIIIGTVIINDGVNSVLGVNITQDPYDVTYDGCTVEKHDISFRLGTGGDAGKVFIDVEKLGGGDLPIQVESQTLLLDCTTGDSPTGLATVELALGTTISPTSYWIYADLTGVEAALKATTTYPPQPFAWLGYYSIADLAYTTANGPLTSRRITSAKSHDGRGRISYIMEWASIKQAQYWSGCTPSASIDAGPTPDLLDFTTLSGIVYQNHRQDWPGITVSTDSIYVANGPGGAGLANLQGFANLTELCGYTSIDAARNTNCRGVLYLFGAINKSTGECKVYCNLPTGTYGGNDGGAYFDYDATSVNTAPIWGRLNSFAIAKIPYDISGGGNTVTFINPSGTTEIVNTLGTPMGVSGGSSGGGGAFTPTLSQVLTEGNSASDIDIIGLRDLDGNVGGGSIDFRSAYMTIGHNSVSQITLNSDDSYLNSPDGESQILVRNSDDILITCLGEVQNSNDTVGYSANVNGQYTVNKEILEEKLLKSPVPSPLDYGATGDGVANDSAAFNAVISASDYVDLRGGTYALSDIVFPRAGIKMYNGTLINHGSTNRMITLAGEDAIEGIRFIGESKTSGLSNDAALYYAGNGSFIGVGKFSISNCTFEEFGGTAITIVNIVDEHQGGTISNCQFTDNNTGVGIANRGEYIVISDCIGNNNNIAISITGGNNNVIGGSYTNNATAIELLAGDNDGHGIISGVSLNHNTTGIKDSSTVAETIVGCHFYATASVFYCTDRTRVSDCTFRSGSSITLNAGSKGIFSDCTFDTGSTPITDNSAGGWLFADSYNLTGNVWIDYARTLTPPTTTTSTGVAGTYSYDGTYFYICTATNTWGRVALDFGF